MTSTLSFSVYLLCWHLMPRARFSPLFPPATVLRANAVKCSPTTLCLSLPRAPSSSWSELGLRKTRGSDRERSHQLRKTAEIAVVSSRREGRSGGPCHSRRPYVRRQNKSGAGPSSGKGERSASCKKRGSKFIVSENKLRV